MHVNGLPLHPLVVHAAVVFVPLAAIAVGVYALASRWRWVLRWPMAVLAVGAALAVQLAAMSGDNLKHATGDHGSLVETHEMWAGYLQAATWVLAGAAVVAWWAMPYVAPFAEHDGHDGRVLALAKPLTVLLPLVALADLYLVFMTGEAGARAVWHSTPS